MVRDIVAGTYRQWRIERVGGNSGDVALIGQGNLLRISTCCATSPGARERRPEIVMGVNSFAMV